MLSLKITGMPCSGPRAPPAARSASSARASAIADGLSASIERSVGPWRSSSDSRARYSRTMSSEVVSPRVSASWICGTVFSKTVNGATGARAGAPTRQLTICDRCSGVRPRTSGAATSWRATSGDARDLRAGRRNLRRGARVRRRVLRRHQRVAQRDRKAAARIVDLAQPLHDEGHQRGGLSRLQRQREHVADVRRIVAGPAVGERIGVHVADGGQQAGRVRAEHVRGRTVARWAAHRIGDVLRVLHHRHEGVGEIDRAVAVRRGRDRHRAAVLERARRAAPGDVDHARPRRRCSCSCRRSGGSRRLSARRGRGRRGRRPARTGVIESKRSPPSCARPKPVRYWCGDQRRAAGRAHAELEIAEAVERVGAAAGGDAAAVLRPGRRVLDVPELAVSGREPRDGVQPQRQRRHDGGDAEGADVRTRSSCGVLDHAAEPLPTITR